MTSISFAKYSGCGNDFIVIDNRKLGLTPHPQLVTRLCHRQLGIGADGIIFLENSDTPSPYRMRIFNADGSEAEMCGNGLRCLAHFIHNQEQTHSTFAIRTMHSDMQVSVNGSNVTVMMPPPGEKIRVQEVRIDQKLFPLHVLDTGVPHAVLFVEDINQEGLLIPAPRIRSHSDFHPRGTNVNFAQILRDKSIAIRTYERGVEQETLACGTGAAAVALAAAATYQIPAPITIRTRSGDCLHIDFQGSSSQPSHLIMSGPVMKVYEGTLPYGLIKSAKTL